jgi:hypothetical protein
MKTTIVLVVGDVRTGTTLITSLLGRYSDVFAAGELHHFKQYREGTYKHQVCECGSSFQLCPLWSRVAKNGADAPSKFELPKSVSGKVLLLLQEALSFTWVLRQQAQWRLATEQTLRLYEHLSKASGRKVIVDSSKWPERAVAIFNYVSDVRIIWMRRDARAVIASKIKRGGISFTLAMLSTLWTSFKIRILLGQVPDGNVLQIRYEELAGAMESTLSRTAVWLRLADDAACVANATALAHQLGGSPRKLSSEHVVRLDDSWKSYYLSASRVKRFVASLVARIER